VFDLAIYSKGAATVGDIWDMTPEQFSIFEKRLNKYYKEKSDAMKNGK